MKKSRLVSAFLAVVMLFSMAITASAAEKATIIINDTNLSATYEGHKLLDLTTSAKDANGNLNYSYTVNADYRELLKTVTGKATDTEIIEHIRTADARAFAEAVYAALETSSHTGKDLTVGAPGTEVDQGYWLIVETSEEGKIDGAVSSVLLDTAGLNNVTVTPKKVVPTVKKEVKDDEDNGSWGETADFSIGETVPFKLTATIPAPSDTDAWDSYDTYPVVFNDTLSEGLIPADGKITATVTVNSGTSFDIEGTVNAKGEFALTIENLKAADGFESGRANNIIVVEYSVTLNQAAVIYTAQNSNSVSLTYDNNPNDDETDGGTTATDTVYVNTFKFDIFKFFEATVEGSTVKTGLANAEFELKDNNVAIPVIMTDAGSANTAAVYRVADAEQRAVPGFESAVITSPASGNITIKGLDEGTYTLKETVAPDGYNLLAEAIEVKIAANGTVTYGTDGTNTVEVLNTTGTELPSTGGMGTVMFQVTGLAILMSAGIFLSINRKKLFSK